MIATIDAFEVSSANLLVKIFFKVILLYRKENSSSKFFPKFSLT